jgi:hypothetical protein
LIDVGTKKALFGVVDEIGGRYSHVICFPVSSVDKLSELYADFSPEFANNKIRYRRTPSRSSVVISLHGSVHTPQCGEESCVHLVSAELTAFNPTTEKISTTCPPECPLEPKYLVEYEVTDPHKRDQERHHGSF